jgi:DNA-binding HxlR family transcriptional regulator
MRDTVAKALSRADVLKYSQTVCDGLRDDDDGVRREVLAHAGNRWSLGVIHTLGVYGQLRNAEIGRRMHGVTQRMLTRTLRHLERDGLVIRHDFEEVVPHVEYALSDTGLELLVRLVPIWTWIVENVDGFRAAREAFDKNDADEDP